MQMVRHKMLRHGGNLATEFDAVMVYNNCMKRETAVFRGKFYHRYPDSLRPWHSRYFSSSGVGIHRDVYKFFFGDIPSGFHVHHIDGNPANNSPGNLELKSAGEHGCDHWKQRKFRKSKCVECGSGFSSRGMGSLMFCTRACKAKHRRDSGKDDIIKKCVICRNDFSASRFDDPITCGRRCGAHYRHGLKRGVVYN